MTKDERRSSDEAPLPAAEQPNDTAREEPTDDATNAPREDGKTRGWGYNFGSSFGGAQ